MKTFKPLPEQLRAADPATSVWVSANAGSGKTRVLVDRVIRLLLQGTDPERVLCVTFTKAAAAEMMERLYRDLGAWSVAREADLAASIGLLTGQPPDGDVLARARRLFAVVLEAPGGLKIQTIHSFCEGVLKRFPIESRLPPHFEVADERTAHALLREAGDRVFSGDALARSTALRAALARIAVRTSDESFLDLIGEVIREVGPTTGDGEAGAAFPAGRVRARLGLDPDDTLERLQARLIGEADVDDLLAAAQALDQGTAKDRERADTVRLFLSGAPDSGAFSAYRSVFLKKDGEKKQPSSMITKGAAATNSRAQSILSDEAERLYSLEGKLKAIEAFEDAKALFAAGGQVLTAYDRLKRERALLDYDDLIRGAQRLIGHADMAAWVLYKLDGGIDHILVDEAQDTAPAQWDVIRAVASEFFAGEGTRGADEPRRTLFAVGDEKQSIYSFQGADPAAVAATRADLGDLVRASGQSWIDEPLLMSFRSTPAVLEVADRVFAQENARKGLVFDDGGKVQHVPARKGAPGTVELWAPVEPEEEPEINPWEAAPDHRAPKTAQARLAEAITQTIGGWLSDGTMLTPRGRPVRAGDILILFRRRGALFETIARTLKAAGVPVAGVDRMVLTEQIAVMDLLALADVALMPDDDLSLACVLKSPLVGLSEEDLFALAHGRSGSLMQALGSARHGGDETLQAAWDLVTGLANLAGYVAPFEFFMEVLERRGGRAKLMQRLGPEAADPIDELINQVLAYERSEPPSLQGFLHWVRASATEVKRELAHGADEVRLMTVHAAKGLEAPIVILPDTCDLPSSRHDPKVLSLSSEPEKPAPVWLRRANADTASMAVARCAARERRAEEYRRLLYVALTRAQDWLIVCGALSKRDTKSGPSAESWYGLVAPVLREIGDPVDGPGGLAAWRYAPPGDAIDPPGDAPAVIAPPAQPAWLTVPAPAEPADQRPLNPSSLETAALETVVHTGGGEAPSETLDARVRGTLVHRLLEILPDLPGTARPDAALRYLSQPALGLPGEEAARLRDETIAVLHDARFAAVFGPGSQAEVAIAGAVPALGGRVISGQIDRLCLTEREVLIVDYKTNRLVPDTVADVPAAYLKQMALYRAALRAIYPGRDVRAALLWTRGPRLMTLPDTLLDAQLPAIAAEATAA